MERETRSVRRTTGIILLALMILQPTTVGFSAYAQTTQDSTDSSDAGAQLDAMDAGTQQEIDDLNGQVKTKQGNVQQLDSVIGNYQKKIDEQNSAMLTLANETALLDNSIKEKQFGIQRDKVQIDIANLQIQALQDQIKVDEAVIARRQDALADILRRVQEADNISTFDAFMARPSLSDFFMRMEEMKRLESDLADATREVQLAKQSLESGKKDVENHRLALQQEQSQLKKEQADLEANRQAKLALVSETQNREQEFQRIVYELRQQQQSESDELAALEDRLKDRLNAADEALARGDVLLYWPIPVLRGVSARFHDPSYPFRKLFEHPGIDLPTDVGTPVHAAAGGYVAWTRTGKQYGNYVMLIHAGGVATVYGHLSRFAVKGDTYVERGDIIGYSGGRPGDQGAGLSTGPHLHFEVRQNGIPVNPENFLPNLE